MSGDMQNEWLKPISATEPSGPSLEYDPEYSLLQTRLASKPDVQYGAFTTKPETPDWVEVERECRRLLLRSKDIHIMLWLLRCRINRVGAEGLVEGLSLLRDSLQLFSETIHPQHNVDGEEDLAVRANALAGLIDPEGVLGDLRNVVVVSNSAARLTVRDVERAFSVPRLADALPSESVQAQLDDLFVQNHPGRMQMLQAMECVADIVQWCQNDLQDEAPDFSALIRVLEKFAPPAVHLSETPQLAESESDSNETNGITGSPSIALAKANSVPYDLEQQALAAGVNSLNLRHTQRDLIRAQLLQIQAWFEENEPSSPVAILLKQAQKMVGQRYTQVAHLIPVELLQAWDNDSL